MTDLTLDEMYADLDEADRLGDAELAKTIADRIRQAEYTTGRRAQAAEIQANEAKTPGLLKTMFTEGPRRAYESVKQGVVALGETFGALPPGAVENMTGDMNVRRIAATGADQGQELAADMGEVATLALPGAFVPGGTSTSLTGAVLRATGRAAAEGVLSMPASETATTPSEVAGDRAMGAALGATMVAPVAAISAAKPFVHNMIVKISQNAERNLETLKARAAAGGWLQGGKRGTMTISQQTGNDIARSLEMQLFATRSANFLNEQIAAQMQRWEALNRWVGKGSGVRPGSTSFLTTARKLSDAYKAGEASAQRAASKAYGDQLAAVVAVAAKDPTRFPVGFSNMQAAAHELSAGSGGADWWRSIYGRGAEAATGPIRQLDKYFKDITAGGMTPALDVQELVLLRKNLNEMDKGFWQQRNNGPDIDPDLLTRHAALSKMIKALDKDVDAVLASNPQGDAAQSLRMFRDANAQYSEFKDAQDFLRQTATAQWFGGYQPADAQKFLVKLGGMEPAQQVVLVNTLRAGGESGKQALHELRVALVQQALDESKKMAGVVASAGPADLQKLSRAMMGDNEALGSRIFTPAQYEEIKKGLAAIRVLEEAPRSPAAARAPNIVGGIMAAGSGSTPFLARLAFQVTGAQRLEKVLFTKEGLESLNTMRELYNGQKPLSANRVAKSLAFMLEAGAIPDEMSQEDRESLNAFMEQYGDGK